MEITCRGYLSNKSVQWQCAKAAEDLHHNPGIIWSQSNVNP
jgi:hypothetical protein